MYSIHIYDRVKIHLKIKDWKMVTIKWRYIKGSTNPIWATIVDIAVRFHCSPFNEFSDERTISMQ